MLVRIAQGLNHMGKGTLTLNALHSDRQLMCPTSAAAVLVVCMLLADETDSKISSLLVHAPHRLPTSHLCLDILRENEHYLLLCLAMAAQPRMLVTLVEKEGDPPTLESVNVQVRVGQAVDVVAQ